MSNSHLASSHREADTLTELQIIAQLTTLGVHFLQGGDYASVQPEIDPAKLLATLALSHQARLRLALIPLLLQHPEFAIYARTVAEQLPQPAQVLLKCYYTAAQLLQQKYRLRLEAIFGQATPLPDLFVAELGLPTWQSPETGLLALAERQRNLIDKPNRLCTIQLDGHGIPCLYKWATFIWFVYKRSRNQLVGHLRVWCSTPVKTSRAQTNMASIETAQIQTFLTEIGRRYAQPGTLLLLGGSALCLLGSSRPTLTR